jgi:hypothetical protein
MEINDLQMHQSWPSVSLNVALAKILNRLGMTREVSCAPVGASVLQFELWQTWYAHGRLIRECGGVMPNAQALEPRTSGILEFETDLSFEFQTSATPNQSCLSSLGALRTMLSYARRSPERDPVESECGH